MNETMHAPIISDAQRMAARRILAINVTRIGDTLLNTPALRALAAFFPHAAITCLGHAKRVEVIAHLPYLTKVGAIDKRSALWRGWARGWTNSFNGPRFDWAFVWGHDRALQKYALRVADKVIAYRQSDEALSRKLFCAADEPRLYSRHGVAMQMALTEGAGIPAAGYQLDYVVTHAETEAARARLILDIESGRRPLIGLQVTSFPTKAYRDWPIAQFIDLAKRIVRTHHSAHFVLFGGPDDRESTDQFRRALPQHTTVYAGRLSLRETVAIMKEIDLYVGVDTGPTHLFGALGKPMVALYHPSLPSGLYKPLQHPALYVVDHPAAGPGADQHIAMAGISVDMVWARVADALTGRPSRYPGMPAVGIVPDPSPSL
ncbi:MAG TPA: glycosyltransferase family 9 protein [Usitatibacteraceae bacterium]